VVIVRSDFTAVVVVTLLIVVVVVVVTAAEVADEMFGVEVNS